MLIFLTHAIIGPMVDRHDEANATSVADSRTTDLGDKVDNQIALLDHIATKIKETTEMVEERKGRKEGWRKRLGEIGILANSLSSVDPSVIDGVETRRPGILCELGDSLWNLDQKMHLLDEDVKRAERIMTPTQREQELLDSIKPLIIDQMYALDPESLQTYQQKDSEGEITKEVALFQLGKFSKTMYIGNIKCECAAYLGNDGRFYIEGPRRRASSGDIVIDVHPYSIEDAMNYGVSFGGVKVSQLVEAVVMCTI